EEQVRGVAVLRDAITRRVGEPGAEGVVVRTHVALAVVHLVVERRGLGLGLGLGLGHGATAALKQAVRQRITGAKEKSGLRFGPEAGKNRVGSPRAAPPPGDR